MVRSSEPSGSIFPSAQISDDGDGTFHWSLFSVSPHSCGSFWSDRNGLIQNGFGRLSYILPEREVSPHGHLLTDVRWTTVTKEDIQEHFKEASGKILDIKLMTGFGFIEYDDPIDARDVVPGELAAVLPIKEKNKSKFIQF